MRRRGTKHRASSSSDSETEVPRKKRAVVSRSKEYPTNHHDSESYDTSLTETSFSTSSVLSEISATTNQTSINSESIQKSADTVSVLNFPVLPEDKRILKYTREELEHRQKKRPSTRSILDRQKFEQEFDPRTLNLSEEFMQMYKDNPHMRQSFVHNRFIDMKESMSSEHRYITEKTPRTKYQRRQGEAKTVEHWGQRKLLMSEIEFLTLHGDDNYTVVYAGAAPGAHTNYLADLFPHLHFLLVDPAPFEAKETEKIKIINDFFTDELAEKCVKMYDKILFISDIRSMQQSMGEEEKEQCVRLDMERQQKWFQCMKARAAMFKFRLPYQKGTTIYLKGKLYLPVWGGRTTTETRLIVERPEEELDKPLENAEYDHNDYEDVMYHFNTRTRTAHFHNPCAGHSGLDHCFDCSSEVFIIGEYLKKMKSLKEDQKDFHQKIIEMSQEISKEINRKGRTLILKWQNPFNTGADDSDEESNPKKGKYEKRTSYHSRRSTSPPYRRPSFNRFHQYDYEYHPYRPRHSPYPPSHYNRHSDYGYPYRSKYQEKRGR